MKIYKTLRKRGLALFMALIMCLSLIPTTALAVEEHVHNEDGWVCTWVDPVTEEACVHTEHDSTCGYAEAVEGASCTHVHDDTCGYTAAVEGVDCTCGAQPGEDGVVTHSADCAYVEAVEGSPCTHGHDDACGYAAAVEGAPCAHECGDACLRVITEGAYTCVNAVRELLDAAAELPEAEDVTAENAAEAGEQAGAVLDLYNDLYDARPDYCEREDVIEAKAAIDALQAAVKAALEGGSEDEVPAEVKAFLDAVAELPAAEDVTPDNAVEIGDQVNAVLDMYEALTDAGLGEREDVAEALNTAYAVFEAVLVAEEIEDDVTFDDNVKMVSSENSLFGENHKYHIYDANYVYEFDLRTIQLGFDIGVGETWVDTGKMYVSDKRYGTYVSEQWSNFNIYSTNPSVLEVSATTSGGTVTITYRGLQAGSASIKLGFDGRGKGTGDSIYNTPDMSNGIAAANCTITGFSVGEPSAPGAPRKPNTNEINYWSDDQYLGIRAACSTNTSVHKKAFWPVTVATYPDSYSLGPVVKNTGANAEEYPWTCTLTVNNEWWANKFSSGWSGSNYTANYGKHYVDTAKTGTLTSTFYWTGSKWINLDSSVLTVWVTCQAPAPNAPTADTIGSAYAAVQCRTNTSHKAGGMNVAAYSLENNPRGWTAAAPVALTTSNAANSFESGLYNSGVRWKSVLTLDNSYWANKYDSTGHELDDSGEHTITAYWYNNMWAFNSTDCVRTVYVKEQPTTYTVYHEYYTNDQRTGSTRGETVDGTVGQVVQVSSITKNYTYDSNTYTYTRANKGNAVTSGPNAYTLGNVITELELAASGNIIVLRYDRMTEHSVTYNWSGLPEGHGQTLPAGGTYAVGAEVTVDTGYPQGKEVTVNGTTYVFSGWSVTEPTGITITDNKFTMPAKNVKITGSWSVKANPGLSVTKTKTENGDIVTYKITVTNTGNVTLYNTMLVDTMEKVLTPTDQTMESVNVTVAGNDDDTNVTLLGVRDNVKAPQRDNAGHIVWNDKGGLTRTTGGDDMWDFTWALSGAFKVGATMTLSYSATINYPENADTVTYKNWADAIAGTSEDDVPQYDGGISTFSFVSGGSGSVGSGSGEVSGTQHKYTLIYDFDGGTYNSKNQHEVSEWGNGFHTFTLDGTVQPTKDGYTFQNKWTGNGSTYDVSGTTMPEVTVTDSDTNRTKTIKAVWTANPAVTFDPNGGGWDTGTAPKKVSTDTEGKVTPPDDPEQTNKVFDGWYTDPTGGDKVDFEKATFAKDTTVYAHWEDDTLIDPTVPENERPATGGDGIPDKYQVEVKYVAGAGGSQNGIDTVVTIKDTSGSMATEGTISIAGATASANNDHYFVNWTAEATGHDDWAYAASTDATLAAGSISAKGGAVYTFTANFQPKTALDIAIVGNTAAVTYDGNKHDVDGYKVSTSLPDGVSVALADGKAAHAEGTAVGTYNMGLGTDSFVLTGDNAGKYTVTFTVTDGWLKIDPQSGGLTVSAEGVTVTYDGQPHPAAVTVKDASGNDVPYTVEYNGSSTVPVDAGAYTAIVKVDGNEVARTTVTILKRGLTVTTGSASKTYDGTALTAPGRIAGLVDGETVTFTVTGTQTNAGSSRNGYTLTWNGTAKESNYDVTNVNLGALTVNRRTLTVTTGSASKRYDGRPLTDSTITITGQAPGESITGVTTGSQTRVGSSDNTYRLTWGAGVLESNYIIVENLGTLRVRESIGGDTGGGTGGGGTTLTPTPIPDTPTPLDPGDTINDQDVPLAGTVGLNDVDHFAYVIGYPDDTVHPLANITRAEAATIFFRLMTEEYRSANWSTSNDFSDVKAGDWYNNAVSTCARAGVVKGYEDGTFRPNAPITRAEFAAMAAGFMDASITDEGVGDFSDTADHWAASAIRRAAKAGWVTGDGNRFRPNDNITRAEVMTIVNRMLDRTPDKDHMLPDMKKWSDNPEDAWYYEAVQEATNEHDYERDEAAVETWTLIKEHRDWAALELGWAANNGASAPAAGTETEPVTEPETQSLPDGI